MSAMLHCPHGHPLSATDTACPVCGPLPPAEPVPLPTEPLLPAIPGHEVRGVLGRGGMGVVWGTTTRTLRFEPVLAVLQANGGRRRSRGCP
jgi:hypothetical protein